MEVGGEGDFLGDHGERWGKGEEVMKEKRDVVGQGSETGRGWQVGDDVLENGVGSQDVNGRGEGATLTNSRGGGEGEGGGSHKFDVVVVAGIKVLDGAYDVLGESDGVEGGEDVSTGEGGEGGAEVE